MSQPSYRLIRVGRSMSGVLGLDEIFADCLRSGRAADALLGEELVRRARQDNYIPPGAEKEFAEALLREYKAYCQAQSEQGAPKPKQRGLWRGLPREQIAWYPTIIEELCNNCGKCVPFCPEKVFDLPGGGQSHCCLTV